MVVAVVVVAGIVVVVLVIRVVVVALVVFVFVLSRRSTQIPEIGPTSFFSETDVLTISKKVNYSTSINYIHIFEYNTYVLSLPTSYKYF